MSTNFKSVSQKTKFVCWSVDFLCKFVDKFGWCKNSVFCGFCVPDQICWLLICRSVDLSICRFINLTGKINRSTDRKIWNLSTTVRRAASPVDRAACRGGISVMVGVSGLSKMLVLTRLFLPRGKIEVSDSQGASLHKILYQAYNMSILLKFVNMSTNFKFVDLSICQFFLPN